MSNWKFLCMRCGKENVGEGLGHCPDRCSSPKAHAERLQAARDGVLEAEIGADDELEVTAVMAIAKLIDAKVALALLERGGS